MNSTLLELAVDQGVTSNALKKWKKRGFVPHKYRLSLLEAAQEKGVGLSSRDFEFPPGGKKAPKLDRPKRSSPASANGKSLATKEPAGPVRSGRFSDAAPRKAA